MDPSHKDKAKSTGASRRIFLGLAGTAAGGIGVAVALHATSDDRSPTASNAAGDKQVTLAGSSVTEQATGSEILVDEAHGGTTPSVVALVGASAGVLQVRTDVGQELEQVLAADDASKEGNTDVPATNLVALPQNTVGYRIDPEPGSTTTTAGPPRVAAITAGRARPRLFPGRPGSSTTRPESVGTPAPTGTPVPETTGTPVPETTDTPVPETTGTPVPETTDTSASTSTTGTPTSTPVPETTGTSASTSTTGTPTSTPVPESTGTPAPTDTPIPEITSPSVVTYGDFTYFTRRGWGGDDVEALRFNSQGNDRWGSAPSYYPAQKVTVHHTADNNIGKTNITAEERVRAIYQYHTIQRNFGDVGYQFLVDAAGNLYEGRYSGDDSYPAHASPPEGPAAPLQAVQGAHVGGNNSGNLGVSLLANFHPDPASGSPGEQLTPEARRTLTRIVAVLTYLHALDPFGSATFTNAFNGTVVTGIPNVPGHRDWANTACPGENFYPLLADVRQDAAALHSQLAQLDAATLRRLNVPQLMAFLGGTPVEDLG